MKVNYCEPSCNYNIKLSHGEIASIMNCGTVVLRPDKIATSHYVNSEHKSDKTFYLAADEYGVDRRNHIQFLTISLEKLKPVSIYKTIMNEVKRRIIENVREELHKCAIHEGGIGVYVVELIAIDGILDKYKETPDD